MAVKDELERHLTKGLHDAPKETVRTIRTISPEILEQLSPNIKEAAAISEGKAIDRPVYSHLKLAVALDADVRYVTEMFGKWVKRGAAKEEVAEFVTLYAPGPKNTARLMDVLWEGTDKADRDSTFLWVTDHIKLNKYGMKDVTAEMEAKEAKTLLDKEKGFMKKCSASSSARRSCCCVCCALRFLPVATKRNSQERPGATAPTAWNTTETPSAPAKWRSPNTATKEICRTSIAVVTVRRDNSCFPPYPTRGEEWTR